MNLPPFKGLNIRIPIRIPIKGREFINQRSTLGFKAWGLGLYGLRHRVWEFFSPYRGESTGKGLGLGLYTTKSPRRL